MKYKIYKLVHNGLVVYVGKTKLTLHQRKSYGYRGCSVESIYKDCDMILIEETNDVSRERYWIEKYKDTILNIRRGNTGMSQKEYRESNREHYKQYHKEWCEANREHYNKYMREYREKKK